MKESIAGLLNSLMFNVIAPTTTRTMLVTATLNRMAITETLVTVTSSYGHVYNRADSEDGWTVVEVYCKFYL